MKHNLLVIAVLFCGVALQASPPIVQYASKYKVVSSSQDSTHKGRSISYKVWSTWEKSTCIPDPTNPIFGNAICTGKQDDHKVVMMGCDFPRESGKGNFQFGDAVSGTVSCRIDWQILKGLGNKNVSNAPGDILFGDIISFKVDDGFLTGADDGSTRLSGTKDSWEEFEIVPVNTNDKGVVHKGQNFALKAKSNGQYLTAEVNGDLRARAGSIGEWEQWHFE